MTFKERWEHEHQGLSADPIIRELCPSDLGYEPPAQCHYPVHGNMNKLRGDFQPCKKCWDREIPEEKKVGPKVVAHKDGYNVKIPETSDQQLKFTHTGEPLAKVKDVVQEPDGSITAHLEPIIKDSGDRTEFESGAVRDMREGKGRCDLMPLEVVANYICEDNDDTNRVLWALREFQKTNSTSYLYSALNSFDGACYEDSFTMFLEVAKHFEEGAKKYGESNWQKGMPIWCYIDSAVRHYLKWLRGDKDEAHDRAFCWNLLCCIWEVDYREKAEEPK